jgi:hypothetical protein
MIKGFHLTELNYNWLSSSFSLGDFKSLGSKTTKPSKDNPEVENPVADTDQSVRELQSTEPTTFACPKEGCVRVFQRLSALDKHLSLEKCTKSLERHSLFDLAKIGYQFRLEEGVGVVPTITPELTDCSSSETACEGWALRAAKKYYRFSSKQKEYLNAKFEIGRVTGRKLNGEFVARQMRRAQGQDGERLFNVSEFLSHQQISSYFSRRAAKLKGTPIDENDLCAYEEEINFATVRISALQTIELEHPITYDQYNICVMAADGTLKKLKLVLLQNMCKYLELDVPNKDIRAKAPYEKLLKEAVSRCTCQKDGQN